MVVAECNYNKSFSHILSFFKCLSSLVCNWMLNLCSINVVLSYLEVIWSFEKFRCKNQFCVRWHGMTWTATQKMTWLVLLHWFWPFYQACLSWFQHCYRTAVQNQSGTLKESSDLKKWKQALEAECVWSEVVNRPVHATAINVLLQKRQKSRGSTPHMSLETTNVHTVATLWQINTLNL